MLHRNSRNKLKANIYKAYNSFRACRFNTDSDEPRVWCHFHTTIMKELRLVSADNNVPKLQKSKTLRISSSISIALDLEALIRLRMPALRWHLDVHCHTV